MLVDHPDRTWLQDVSTGIDAWLVEAPSTPTSQLTGGGAIARAESLLSALHGARPTLLMPSASYALWVALRALGVRPGDEVLIPQYDWTSTLAVVLALGAEPVVVPIEPATLTVDPAAAAARRTARTSALVATHLFGIPSDIPGLRDALPRLPIVEDCAQAFSSMLDGSPVGTLGDASVFSFGPGKTIDVGELGALILRDADLHEMALRESAHPIRQRLSGIEIPSVTGVGIRPHPLAAVLLCSALVSDNRHEELAHRARTYACLDRHHWPIRPYGIDDRREIAAPYVVFAPDSLTDKSLDGYVGYREVADIESIRQGIPKLHRIGSFQVFEPLRKCAVPRQPQSVTNPSP